VKKKLTFEKVKKFQNLKRGFFWNVESQPFAHFVSSSDGKCNDGSCGILITFNNRTQTCWKAERNLFEETSKKVTAARNL